MFIFDLNEPPPIEEEDDAPFIGQTFESQEEAYIFYNKYAKRQGFVAVKDRTDTKHGRTIRQDFVCLRAGKPRSKVVDMSKVHRKRSSSKCGCRAYMRITLRKSFDIFPEEWHVTIFVKEHNHDLLSGEELRFLPANRNITTEDEKKILLYKEAGLSIRHIIRVMELEKNLNHGDLPFFGRDIRNFYGKVKKMIGPDDAKNLMEYMKSAKEQKNIFHYVYTLDEERRLENLFWCHAESFEWYQKYGDVVVFDTTYKVNSFDMPCAIFVGLDNHGKTILFGFALLRNETAHTFKWLMKTFVNVKKKPPKTIITDQDASISDAIATEMPTTKHSYCIWHITSKFSSWLTALLRDKYQEWCGEFYNLYKITHPEEFEHNWNLMVEKFNLQNNKYILGLYKVREFWAPAYLRDYFFGGMITTGRSESINAFIKRFVSSHTCLTDFVKQVDLAVQEIRQRRLHEKVVTTLRPVSLSTKSPLEKQAREVFSPFAFNKFQEEFTKAALYTINEVDNNNFVIKYFEGDTSRQQKVFWDENISMCTCKNFEFWGIICRHILRVFVHKDCFTIPLHYLPLRWHCDESEAANSMEDNNLVGEECLANNSLGDGDVVLCPPPSKTKGRPKTKRCRGGKELGVKKTKCCSICKQSGHTKPTCPNKENFFNPNILDGDISLASQKKRKHTAEDFGLNPIFTLKI